MEITTNDINYHDEFRSSLTEKEKKIISDCITLACDSKSEWKPEGPVVGKCNRETNIII